MSAKTSKSIRSLSNAHRPLPVGGAHALPEVGAPVPPADAAPAPRAVGRGLSPHPVHLDVASDAASELRASKAFPLVVGERLARADDVANAIEFASRWHREAKSARAWQRYTQQQSQLAWLYVTGVLETLRGPLTAGSATFPEIAQELHAFLRMLNARSDAAKRGRSNSAARARAKERPRGQPATPDVPNPAPAAGDPPPHG